MALSKKRKYTKLENEINININVDNVSFLTVNEYGVMLQIYYEKKIFFICGHPPLRPLRDIYIYTGSGSKF